MMKRDTAPVPFSVVSSRFMSERVNVDEVPSNGKKPARPSLDNATTCTAVGTAGELSAAAAAAGDAEDDEDEDEEDDPPGIVSGPIWAPQPATSQAAAAALAARRKTGRQGEECMAAPPVSKKKSGVGCPPPRRAVRGARACTTALALASRGPLERGDERGVRHASRHTPSGTVASFVARESQRPVPPFALQRPLRPLDEVAHLVRNELG